jgi:hypothetical protein
MVAGGRAALRAAGYRDRQIVTERFDYPQPRATDADLNETVSHT